MPHRTVLQHQPGILLLEGVGCAASRCLAAERGGAYGQAEGDHRGWQCRREEGRQDSQREGHE